jgi:hypothetical protein
MAICMLCQREGKLSREHAIPSWVGRELNTSGAPVGHQYEGPPGTGTTWKWQALAVDIKVKVICEPCNYGPLSNLEAAAKEVLTPLIHGRGRLLTSRECKLVTRWFLKTMLMLDLAGRPEHRVALPEHEQWVREELVPQHVTLWLGAARQLSGTATAGRALDIQVGERNGTGWIFTIIIGHLILVTIAGLPGIDGFDLTAPLSSALTRIWPQSSMTAPYPPRTKLGRRQVSLVLDLVQQSIPARR